MRNGKTLETELILLHVLSKNVNSAVSDSSADDLSDVNASNGSNKSKSLDRSYLVLHENDLLTTGQLNMVNKMHQELLEEKPLAYILKEKEFYGRKFYVDERVLIPRPETENLVDIVKEIVATKNPKDKKVNIIDVGTGSGCLAITLKLELKDAFISGIDLEKDALKVAEKNAKNLEADVKFYEGDLLKLKNIGTQRLLNQDTINIIVANLPYVDRNWDWTSKNLRFEPATALFAEDGGLSEIKRLILEVQNLVHPFQAPNTSKSAQTAQVFADKCCKNYNIFLVLELDPSQRKPLDSFVKTLDPKPQKLEALSSLKVSNFASAYRF